MKNVKTIATTVAVIVASCEYVGAMKYADPMNPNSEAYQSLDRLSHPEKVEEMKRIVLDPNSTNEQIMAVAQSTALAAEQYFDLQNRGQRATELECYKDKALGLTLLGRLFGIVATHVYRYEQIAAEFILDSAGFWRRDSYANDPVLDPYRPWPAFD